VTGETLDGGKKAPLVEARRAHASGVERVPLMSARARPAVAFAGDQPPQSGHRMRGLVEAFLLLNLAIQDGGRFGAVIRERTHASVL